MSSGISELDLNAFVDGELSPAMAAHVASVVATDPKLARRVAHMYRLKAALSGMADDLSVPELPRSEPSSATSRRMAIGLSSAAAAAAVLTLLWFVPTPFEPTPGPERQVMAVPLIAQHDQWVARATGGLRFEWPDGFGWLEPVMGASGLKLVHRTKAGDVHHFGFKGPNGCRVSLFVTDKRRPDSPLRLTLSEHIQHAQGQAGAFEFEMMARDMALARFATVATKLHRNNHDRDPDRALTVAVLQATRLPCAV